MGVTNERFTRNEKDSIEDAITGLETVIRRLSADIYDHNYRARVIRAENLLRELLRG